jgi:hypothetical protein
MARYIIGAGMGALSASTPIRPIDNASLAPLWRSAIETASGYSRRVSAGLISHSHRQRFLRFLHPSFVPQFLAARFRLASGAWRKP